MDTVETIIFYMILMGVSMYCVEHAKKKNDYRYILIPILLLSFVAGCRSYEVGTDTIRVVESIEYTYKHGTFAHSKEYLYYLLCELSMHVWKNPSFVLFVVSLLTNTMIFFRIWDFRKEIRISVSVAMYFMFYFGMSMNIGRQCLAVAIIFYFTRFLAQRDYKKFIIGIVIAFLVHVSSAIAVVLLLFYYCLSEKMSKEIKRKCAYIALAGLLPLGYMIYRYASYFLELKIDIGTMQIVWTMLVVTSYLPVLIKQKSLFVKAVSRGTEHIAFVFLMAIIGCFIALIAYIVPGAGRIGYMFKIYEIIYFGMLLQRRDYDNRLKAIIAIMILLLGIYTLLTYSAVVPYAFVW